MHQEKKKAPAGNAPRQRGKEKEKTTIIVIEEDSSNVSEVAGQRYLSAFSQLLRSLMSHDHSELVRVARELKVTENTIYRWMNGNSKPHMMYLKKLPDVFPTHRASIIQVINQTFPGVLDFPAMIITPVDRDIYARVSQLVTVLGSPEMRLTDVALTLFEHILQHLDSAKGGLSATYAMLMPPREDGYIHALFEVISSGSPPWPQGTRSKAFLGSNSLAGSAARSLRLQLWDSLKQGNQLAVQIDDFEVSACAVPVMRGGLIAGVLIISSAQAGFFENPTICEAADEYARMLGHALQDVDFYTYDRLLLRLMPALKMQHALLAETLVERSIQYAQKMGISHSEAKKQVAREMEGEMEQIALAFFEQE